MPALQGEARRADGAISPICVWAPRFATSLASNSPSELSMSRRIEHVEDANCWCRPRFFVPCAKCGPSVEIVGHASVLTTVGDASKTCAFCGNGGFPGLVETDAFGAQLAGSAHIVLHNDYGVALRD